MPEEKITDLKELYDNWDHMHKIILIRSKIANNNLRFSIEALLNNLKSQFIDKFRDSDRFTNFEDESI